MWLNGAIDQVTAMTETFIKERQHTLTGQVEKVGIDDASAFLARFRNGSLATFEATRYARGHKALYTLEINGEHASIFWDLHDLHRLEYFDHRDEGRLRGWRSIHITDGDHPYMKHWWVPGLQIGYEHTFVHQAADFLEGLSAGQASRAFVSATAWRPTTSPMRCCARRGAGGGSRSGPAAHDHLLLGVEGDGVAAMRVQVSEERLLPAGEREEGHGRGHADIDADHADLDARGIFAGRFSVSGEDGRSVAEWRPVHQIDGGIEILDADHGEHRAEDLLARDGHVGRDVVENRGAEEVAAAGAGLTTVAEWPGAFGHAFLDVAFDALAMRRR